MSAAAGGFVAGEAEFEIGRGNRWRDGVADSLVEAVVGAVAKQERLLVIGSLIEVVAGSSMVAGGEIVGVNLDAHLYAEVVDRIEVQAGAWQTTSRSRGC